MNVKVLYFALARDLTLTRSEAITVPEGTSVRELLRSLGARHPALGKLKDSIKCSVNLSIATPETTLMDGDEVGVLPPVAGG